MRFVVLQSSLIACLFCATNSVAQIQLPKLPDGVGVCVVDLDRHALIASHNDSTPLKPASIQKLILSGAVLEQLGSDYHFYTEVGISGRKGATVESLYIRGGGDPSMTTERLWLFARQVYALGIREIKSLHFDDSAFEGEKSREGQRAYLTGSSALSLNFNSITIRACPTTPGDSAAVSADPWESGAVLRGEVKTALRGQGISADLKNESAPPSFQVSGRVEVGGDCDEVYRSVPSPERYFAQTLSAFLQYLGIAIPKNFDFKALPPGVEVVIRFPSVTLSQILRDMNLYSSNFIAEQLLSALGQEVRGGEIRFSRARGLVRLTSYLNRVAESQQLSEIFDGSGLSHENRVQTKSFCRVIDRINSNFSLATEFLSSLPASGISGTLKKRDFDTSSVVVRAKTGSLNGVSSLAGVLSTSSGKKLGFAIIQNRPVDKVKAIELEDNLVQALLRG